MPTRSRAYVGDVACVAPFGARGTLLAGAGASVHRFALGTDGARRMRRERRATRRERGGVRGDRACACTAMRDLRDGETCAVWGERRVRVMRLRDGDGDARGDGDGWTAETPLAPFAAWVHDVRGIADDDGARGRAMAIGFSDNAVELMEARRGGRRLDARGTRGMRVEMFALYARAERERDVGGDDGGGGNDI